MPQSRSEKQLIQRNPNSIFKKYLEKQCGNRENRQKRFISLGAGWTKPHTGQGLPAGRGLATRVVVNFRFAAVGGGADIYEPSSDGVVWWSSYKDEARHRAGRCRCPDPASRSLFPCGALSELTRPRDFAAGGSIQQ